MDTIRSQYLTGPGNSDSSGIQFNFEATYEQTESHQLMKYR
jgi:hypothetical protein